MRVNRFLVPNLPRARPLTSYPIRLINLWVLCGCYCYSQVWDGVLAESIALKEYPSTQKHLNLTLLSHLALTEPKV